MGLFAGARPLNAMAERGTAVLAYDVATGQRRWSAPVDADARGPVVPSEDAVLVLEASGVTALDAATGAPRWKAKTKEKAAQGNLLRTHGLVVAYTGSAGMTGDDGHKTPSYGHISAFDAATGTRRWDFDAKTLSVLTAGHDAVYAEHRNSVLDAFAPTTGDILWRAALPDTAAVSHGARVCGDGMVYATGSEKLYAFSA